MAAPRKGPIFKRIELIGGDDTGYFHALNSSVFETAYCGAEDARGMIRQAIGGVHKVDFPCTPNLAASLIKNRLVQVDRVLELLGLPPAYKKVIKVQEELFEDHYNTSFNMRDALTDNDDKAQFLMMARNAAAWLKLAYQLPPQEKMDSFISNAFENIFVSKLYGFSGNPHRFLEVCYQGILGVKDEGKIKEMVEEDMAAIDRLNMMILQEAQPQLPKIQVIGASRSQDGRTT